MSLNHCYLKTILSIFVVAGEIIEHLCDSRFFLESIHRVLQINEYLILSTSGLARIDDRLKFLLGKTPRQIAPYIPIFIFIFALLPLSY